MVFKIVGHNTLNGIKLRKIVVKIAEDLDDQVIITLLETDYDTKIPLLYINNKLVFKGRIPKEKELIKYIKNNL